MSQPNLRAYTFRDELTMRSVAITLDDSRDALLTSFAKETLKDRYLLAGESFQDMFGRVACANSDEVVWGKSNSGHAQQIYDYISQLWFMPATPVLSNSGTARGLPISCFLNEVGDSMLSINDMLNENFWLAAMGGGIGTYFGNVRGLDEEIGRAGKHSGVISFAKIMDAMTLGISQGSLRRGSAATYLGINHPDINEFLEMRRASGGDPNRKCLNLHHGVAVTDKFMEAVEAGADWDLISPKTGEVRETVSARQLWVKLITTRLETGEPYILFIDRVNENLPAIQKYLGLTVKTSNLCVEITLPTGEDHLGNWRTAVCCLSSLNIDYADEWIDDQDFIEAVARFLDNVLERFIRQTAGMPGFDRARYAAERERSIGLGVMGFHSYLQSHNIPFESATATKANMRIFKFINEAMDEASLKLGLERGPCLDGLEAGVDQRFSNKTALAPTASISIIAGASATIEPIPANVYSQKTLAGTHTVRNKHLEAVLLVHAKRLMEKDIGWWINDQWDSIGKAGGSVQHLDYLTDDEKAVFRTAFEIDQKWVIDHAADRTPFISQSQSLNIYLPSDVHKKVLYQLHMRAWKKGLKSLYYCRSKSIQRAGAASHTAGEMPTSTGAEPDKVVLSVVPEMEVGCESCQ